MLLLFLFLVVINICLDVLVVFGCDIDEAIIGEDDEDDEFNEATCEVVERVFDEVLDVEIIDGTLLVCVDIEDDNVLEDGLIGSVVNGIVDGAVNGLLD